MQTYIHPNNIPEGFTEKQFRMWLIEIGFKYDVPEEVIRAYHGDELVNEYLANA